MTAIELNSVVNVPTQPVRFLIIDDDHVSVLAIKRALKKLKIINPVQVARDGREALEMLRGEFGDGHRLPPYLVTLDLNMPRMNGFEFLEEVRNDPALHRLVIFVLSTSDAPADVANAYDNNIAGYIVKDNLGDSFVKALDMIDCFTRVVEFPH
ncbi:response regulator [Roseovarius aestuarii]|uniref:Response regulator rcp1 n=1 Tax=Roseovarius aestuarii TaxID=475083 RepID=A0A1X7BQL3_9RHOB|nr:response regulator [Roseovarius aestuarii]SMC11907.1 Response regulator rcp1 [Roseovarius aestuarii]